MKNDNGVLLLCVQMGISAQFRFSMNFLLYKQPNVIKNRCLRLSRQLYYLRESPPFSRNFTLCKLYVAFVDKRNSYPRINFHL